MFKFNQVPILHFCIFAFRHVRGVTGVPMQAVFETFGFPCCASASHEGSAS